MIFSKDADTYASFEKQYDADGKVWMYAQAHGTLTALTPYLIIANEFGPLTAANAAGAFYCYIGVPEEAWASGEIAKLQIGGPVSDVVTASITGVVGYGFTIVGGAVAMTAGDLTGIVAEFAACTAASSSSSTQDMMLIPERILTRAS